MENVIFSVMSRTKKVAGHLAGATVSGVSHSGEWFQLNGKGTSTRPTLTLSNLYGWSPGWRKICRVWSAERWSGVGLCPFSGCGELRQRKQRRRSEQEVISRWRIEQCSELSAVVPLLYCPRRRKRTALFFQDVHAGQHLHLDLSRR